MRIAVCSGNGGYYMSDTKIYRRNTVVLREGDPGNLSSLVTNNDPLFYQSFPIWIKLIGLQSKLVTYLHYSAICGTGNRIRYLSICF